jgi:hypothetical protein
LGAVLEEKRLHLTHGGRSSDGPQAQYRLYFLQGAGRRITFSHEFEAKDDDRAVDIAESWLEGRSAELWTGSRRVKSWEADA